MPLKRSLHLIKRNIALVSIAGFFFASLPGGLAADAQDEPWRFGVTVPLWAAGIEGDMTVRGQKADVDIGFDDLADHLDASFSLGLDARKGRLGFYSGVGYMKFSADGTGARGGKADYELKFLIADAGVSYRLVQTAGERPFILEAIGGVRYWATESDLRITGPQGGVLVNSNDKNDLIDPVIGLRCSKYLTRKFHLDFQGDIGGFDVSDDSAQLDWSATGLATYDFAKWFSLSAGYKALALKVENGSGAEKNGADIVMHGLLITARLQF